MEKELISCIVPSHPITIPRVYNLEIMLVLGDRVNICIDGNERVLKHNDILAINKESSFSTSGCNNLVLFSLDNSELKKALEGKNYIFICDSDKSISGNYDGLRKLLEEILTLTYSNHPHKNIKKAQLFYELVFFLVHNFAAEKISYDVNEKDRLLNYLYNFYQEDISLESVADYFGMTPQYFSKYFKKITGDNFLNRLTIIRLSFARDELLNTNKKLISIAMDNGFNDIGTFNRCFKRIYGISPARYKEENAVVRRNVSQELELSKILQNINKDSFDNENQIYLQADAHDKKSYKQFWRKVLNFGRLSKVDSANIFSQLNKLQGEISFEYIRISLDLNRNDSSFAQEECWFDNLYKLGFKIWLEINLRDVKDFSLTLVYIKHLISYMTNRYGIHNIKSWFFELEYNTSYNQNKINYYLDCHEKLVEVLKCLGLEKRIVAAGLSTGNVAGIKLFYNELYKRGIEIKDNSFLADPFTYFEDENGDIMVRPGEQSNFISELMNIRNSQYFSCERSIYICSWKGDVRKLSVFNDSCYKGALMVSNLIECFGLVDGFSIDVPFDSDYEVGLQKSVLFGGGGMVSHHGINKPVYYALKFFTYVGNFYLNKNEKAIIFTNDSGNYHVICHNLRTLNYRSYMDEEIDMANITKYFDSQEDLNIHVHIDNVDNGIYKIKKRAISTDYGSVQDEFIRMCKSTDVFIHPNDVDYLKDISVPRISLDQIRINNGVIDLNIVLKANEFAFLHIVRTF